MNISHYTYIILMKVKHVQHLVVKNSHVYKRDIYECIK